jgi:RNA recognition motif. (a.k.a. RRM, RBD, or RNP domain)
MSRARSRSPVLGGSARGARSVTPSRALLDDALRRAGDATGAGAALAPLVAANIKLEPVTDVQIVGISKHEAAHGTQHAAAGAGGSANGQDWFQQQLPWSLMGGNGDQEQDPCSVVVQNVHFEATPEAVGLFFEDRVGSVVRVTILKNAHGMSKGYAYMELASPAAAQNALTLNGANFMARNLKVRKRPPSS